jgi:acid phosphatase
MCAEYRRSPFAFVLTTGDNFYPTGDATAANFTRPERCLTALGVRWRAAWGNHDIGGTSTADVLGSPRRHYAFSAGPARILVLDGNDPSDPQQLRFIREQLRDATEPVRIVAVHQPLRTAGLHGPSEAARRLWEPLLRRGRVTLVLQGHNHMYERIVAGGITYITTGGGGAQLYPCVRPAAGLRRCVFSHHFLAVNVTASRVSVRAISPSGTTLERVVIPVRPPV